MTVSRVFLDTNIYILGASEPESAEALILRWIGFETGESQAEVIMSDEVLDQIRRVGRRLFGKDWAGELLTRLWRNVKLVYVAVDAAEWSALLETETQIPREDLSVYLTARTGGAQCFVSSNHRLVSALAGRSNEFECLSPEAFVERYLA